MQDFLGQELAEFDYVAGVYSNNDTPAMFQITSFTPKKCRLIALSDTTITGSNNVILKFGHDLIKLDPASVKEIVKQRPLDALLRELEVGDYVYGSQGEYIDPIIFEIIEFRPTKAVLKVVYPKGQYVHDGNSRYTNDLIKIEPGVVTMYLLSIY